MGLYNNRIVVKVGTSTLTNDSGKSDLRATDRLVCTLADIHNMGYEVILVSSGAIAVGRNKLNMHARPDSMRMKQAAAAVGQCSLMYLYDKFFGDYDKTVAQILLNAEDIEQEEKKENLTNTFNALLEMGVIPIVNENDSVSYTEIESEDRLFGDNDMLSSVVAVLCRAKKLVILSDIDGFYDSDPRLHPNAKLIEQIDDELHLAAGGTRVEDVDVLARDDARVLARVLVEHDVACRRGRFVAAGKVCRDRDGDDVVGTTELLCPHTDAWAGTG